MRNKSSYHMEGNFSSVCHMFISYLLAAVTWAIGFFLFFRFREVIKIMLIYSRISPWSWRAIEVFSFVVLGMLWLILAIICQHLYEKEISDGWKLTHFMLITSIELILLFICNLIIYSLIQDYRTTLNTVCMVSQMIFGGAALAFYLKQKIKSD